jgi:FAS-associated factor 2
MRVLDRFQGLPRSLESLLVKLDSIISRINPELVAQRYERQERETGREIRDQQDAAYQASLTMDREKAVEREKERQIEKERLVHVLGKEEKREEMVAARLALVQEAKDTLPVEPVKGDVDTTKIMIRLPNGDRIVRTFRANDKISVCCFPRLTR